MNAPQFSFSRIPVYAPANDVIKAVVAEEKRICDAIDARMNEVRDEFSALVDRLRMLEGSLESTKGFFARFLVKREMKDIARRIRDNRSQLDELATARWRRTYGP
jgi:phage-related tail protein